MRRGDTWATEIVSGEAPQPSLVHTACPAHKGLMVASCGGGRDPEHLTGHLDGPRFTLESRYPSI